ncbi:hypothetical protein PSHT_07628 [Puccinia striiformis]|uniref:Uncharacterized protein n=1 Tax=Puccinia striiformis TaxID=27350 RepID=A0A2S4VW60_9BASI|nr:hypothetical protein PSHT_07628 [Puccinia striiformis]
MPSSTIILISSWTALITLSTCRSFTRPWTSSLRRHLPGLCHLPPAGCQSRPDGPYDALSKTIHLRPKAQPCLSSNDSSHPWRL